MANDNPTPTNTLGLDTDRIEKKAERVRHSPPEDELIDFDTTGNKVVRDVPQPQVEGEASLSGHMRDEGSNDDLMDARQKSGVGLDESSEQPRPLDIAEDVAAAEELRRSAPEEDPIAWPCNRLDKNTGWVGARDLSSLYRHCPHRGAPNYP